MNHYFSLIFKQCQKIDSFFYVLRPNKHISLFMTYDEDGLRWFTCVVPHMFDGETLGMFVLFHNVCSLIQRNIHLITIACIIHVHARKLLYFIKYVALLLTTRKHNSKIVYQHLENNTWKVQALMNFLWV